MYPDDIEGLDSPLNGPAIGGLIKQSFSKFDVALSIDGGAVESGDLHGHLTGVGHGQRVEIARISSLPLPCQFHGLRQFLGGGEGGRIGRVLQARLREDNASRVDRKSNKRKDQRQEEG